MTGDQAITVLNVAALATMMVSMGLQVTFRTALTSARPASLVVKCLIANFAVVPLVTVALLYLFQTNSMVAVGFLILAVCPGAPVGPPLAAVARGNLSIAIGMMVILAGLSSILAPVLLTFLLPRIGARTDLQIDQLTIVRTLLVAQLLPLVLGFSVHHFAPRLTMRIARPIDMLGKVLMILLLAAILVAKYDMLAEIRMRGWIGMCVLLAASLLIGWLCGGRERENRKAMAVTTGPRNAAVGLVIASSSFANTPAQTAVVAYGFASMIGTLIFASIAGRIPNSRPPCQIDFRPGNS